MIKSNKFKEGIDILEEKKNGQMAILFEDGKDPIIIMEYIELK